MTAAHLPGKAFAIWFKDLRGWDIKTAISVRFSREHPTFHPLKEFAEESTELIRPSEAPLEDWPVYGVNNEVGVFFSHYQKGSAFNAPYKRIRKDWFFHNPTRANVGSLGRVPEVPDNAITSPEYQVWRIREGITPDFMEVLLRMKFFQNQIEFNRVGAVKERLFTQNLLQIRVPVLPLHSQELIVAHWRAAQKTLVKSRTTIAKLESETLSRFFTFLDLKPPKAGDAPKAFAVSWKDFFRWSVSYNQAALDSDDLSRGKYPVMDLGELLSSVQYGTSEKANSFCKGTPIIRMNNIRNGLLDLADLKHIELNSNERDRLLLQDGDILFNRTNSKELVGKCAVFHEAGEYIFASYLIRVRVRPDKALPDYTAFFLNSPFGRQQINALSRHIIGQANINTEELKSLQISVPPLEVQREIEDMVKWLRKRIADERKAADELQVQASREVEEMILGIRRIRYA